MMPLHVVIHISKRVKVKMSYVVLEKVINWQAPLVLYVKVTILNVATTCRPLAPIKMLSADQDTTSMTTRPNHVLAAKMMMKKNVVFLSSKLAQTKM
jgi:hypothetical protein